MRSVDLGGRPDLVATRSRQDDAGLPWINTSPNMRSLAAAGLYPGLGIIESAPKAHGRGHLHRLTSSGQDLFQVCEALGEWGARWLEIAPENLDPFVALWSMCNALHRDRLPDQRVVIRLDFTGFRPHERYWLLFELGEVELCKTYAGLDEDLYITADADAFVKWHAGQLAWAEATRDRRIQLDGPSWLEARLALSLDGDDSDPPTWRPTLSPTAGLPLTGTSLSPVRIVVKYRAPGAFWE